MLAETQNTSQNKYLWLKVWRPGYQMWNWQICHIDAWYLCTCNVTFNFIIILI